MEMTKEDYQKKMEAQLNEWSARVDVLKAKAEKASATAKIELQEQIEKLKALEVSAREHFTKIQGATATAWNDVKADVTDKWNQVSGAVEALWSRVSS
jgi:DNA uptake protein ComE-like DNA-binding protein